VSLERRLSDLERRFADSRITLLLDDGTLEVIRVRSWSDLVADIEAGRATRELDLIRRSVGDTTGHHMREYVLALISGENATEGQACDESD
jgi:hypothetical protein